MAAWLLKTEPSTYSLDDLERQKKTRWDGVSNPAALNNIKRMQPGERCFIYHTGDEKQIVGIAKVLGEPYADPGDKGGTLWAVDIGPVKPLANPVTLKAVKADPRFADFLLVRMSRLSVMPVTDEQWTALEAMSR